GRAELAEVRTEVVHFDSLNAVVNKPLNHPALKDLTVQPALKATDTQATVTLRVQGDFDRLTAWDGIKDDLPLPVASRARRAVAGGVELEKTYGMRLPRGAGLSVTVVTTGAKKAVEFRFENLELP